MMSASTVKEERTNPRRAKTPAGVWLIVGLTLLFGLGGFGIAAFIAIRALRAGKGAGVTEVQPARSPAVTAPVPRATAVPSSSAAATVPPSPAELPSPSPAGQVRMLVPGTPPPAAPVNPSPAAQASSDLKPSTAPPDSSPADSVSPEPTPTLAVAIEPGTVPDAGPSPDANGNPNQPDRAATPPRATGPDDTPVLLEKDPEEEQRVRQEVLVRVDLLKELTQAEKDHLYSQVERARGFTKLAVVPFPSGRVLPENNQVEHLLSYLRRPNFQKLFEDPTVVLVCAGYADRKGSEAQNLEISQRRAENMVRILQSQTKIRNLMRAVGMGGSDLFDKTDAAKNRVVEIWLVQP
jgi:outer membrane protein OmpA-like peptidoglycan-associated protein